MDIIAKIDRTLLGNELRSIIRFAVFRESDRALFNPTYKIKINDSCERKFYPRHGYYNAMARICRACGYIGIPIEYLPVRKPPVCMNGLYYV